MKLKLYTILSFAALAALNASAYDRFQYPYNQYDANDTKCFWYEILDDGTCQLAECTTMYFEEKEVGTGKWEWTPEKGSYEVKELRKVLSGQKDKNALPYYNGVYGPNMRAIQPDSDPLNKFEIPEKVIDHRTGKEYTVTKIGKFSFAGSDYGSSFNEIVLPPTITEIGEGAFYKIEKLVSVDLSNVKIIGDYAFYDCSSLLSLKIPNTTTYIGEYAFWDCSQLCSLELGNSIEEIGAYAFKSATIGKDICQQDRIVLPSTLKHIGPYAFDFTRTADGHRRGNGQFQDIYVGATTPPYMDSANGFTGFGNFDPDKVGDNFYNVDSFWMYPWCCLHVPRGSYNAYAREYNEDGTFNPWSQFTCIIDDIIPDEEMSLDEVVGYVYMAPGDVTQVDPNILPGFNERWGNYTGQIDPSWDSEADDVATITEEGRITALKYGKKLAVAKASIGNKIWNGSKFEDVEEIVGVIVIYVCPTVVLATNLNESDLGVAQDNPNIGGDSSSAGSSEDDGIHVLADNDTPVIAGAEYPAPATDNYTTYEHLVVPESFPQFKITPAYGFEITNTMHGNANVDRSWDESVLKPLVDGDYDTDTDARQEEVAIALEEPITNNRVVYIEINQIEGLDLGTTGVQEFEVGNDMKVRVDGTNIMVEGAEANDVLTVSNLNGQTLVRTTEKSVSVSTPGMYLVTISSKKATTTFKVIAK